MRLSLQDQRRINAIITDLTDEDFECIRAEVERLDGLKRQNPLFNAIADYAPEEFTTIANEWLSLSDLDYQVLLSKCFWDAMTARVTREYAIRRFLDDLEA